MFPWEKIETKTVLTFYVPRCLPIYTLRKVWFPLAIPFFLLRVYEWKVSRVFLTKSLSAGFKASCGSGLCLG